MKFFPKSADGFLSAMMMAENALLRDFSLSCPASLFGAEPMESAKKAVKSCMTLSSFPCAQMLKTNTRYVHDFAKRTLTVTVNARYMSTGKEVNDLRCVVADIAESIKRGLPESTDFFQVIAAYQSWLKRFFVYKKTGATRDHAAVGLLQTRQGVCQAIAALSMVILPHLGILARYVCGEGYSGTDWGPHAWNAVWAPNGAWHQVDFTFGLHRKTTPNTFTPPDDLHFRELHRWDEVAQSPPLFQNVQTLETACKLRPFCCSRTTRSRPRSAASRCCLTSLCCKTAACAFCRSSPCSAAGASCSKTRCTLCSAEKRTAFRAARRFQTALCR